MPPRGDWSYPTRIRFGPGRVGELPEACAEAGIRRPLLVTDRGLAKSPVLDAVRRALAEGGLPLAVFDGVTPNPGPADLDAGITAFRSHGCDGVVAVGGGSALDVGKLVAFQQGQRRPVWDFEDVGDNWKRADEGAIAPVVTVPTTAGTGSEVGRAAVLTHPSGDKKILFHPRMMPRVVVADPELTFGLPPDLTVGTGMDALAHCLEAYCAPGFHPMADGIAMEGVRLVFASLERAVRSPRDGEARARMLAASIMGGTAFQKGLGAVHALSHPIGGRFGGHHGTLNAVLMPYVLAFNRPAVEARIARLAALLGLGAAFDAFLAALVELRRRLGVPERLADLGLPREAAREIAEAALRDPSAAGNPRPLDAGALERLYLAAFDGRPEDVTD